MKNRFRFLHLLALSLIVLASCSKGRLSRKEMEAELKELKAQSAQNTQRVQELEEELKNQTRLEQLEEEQKKLQADFEAAHEEIVKKTESETDGIELTKSDSPSPTPAAPVAAPETNQGMSFTAVRTVVTTQAPPPAAAPAPVAAPPQSATPPAKPLSAREQRISDLRQELRDEINRVFAQIKARRATRYGEKGSRETSDTYIKNNTYDPDTGENKRGGKKPKLAVDLDTGLNEEFPEESVCLDNLSLSTTFLRARAIRDEIIELKNQGTLR